MSRICAGGDVADAEPSIISEDESIEEKPQIYGPPIYDSMVFDVDGDGKDEYCVLGYGRTSGLFTFTFFAIEIGADHSEYNNVFCTDWYDLSFIRCNDGVVRVQGINQKKETHLFDIAIIDGYVYLTKEGQDIGSF